MAYTDIYDQAVVADSTLRKQITVALHKAAGDIANESPSTENHSQRLAWARRVFLDTVSWSSKAVWVVMQNATIAANPAAATDNDVQFVVNSNVSNFIKL
jgi:hypothetical protein